jgi:aspartyl aminopeptidase
MENNIKELMEFLDSSITAYQAVDNTKKILENNGFTKLYENKIWSLDKNGKYFVIRNDSSIMAFTMPNCDTDKIKGFHVYAAHSDSPAFKIKENPEMTKEGSYVTINTEKYGGMILSTWLDRPLTIAGRVCIEENGEIKSYPVKLKDNICMIPNIAIHMNRDMNDGVKLNPQVDMIPLISLASDNDNEKLGLKDFVADELSKTTGKALTADDILSYDLFVENSEKSVLAGAKDEFIMSARYDDLGCVFAGTKALIDVNSKEYINVLAVFDNEEVGSLTRQGADSTLLKDTLENIADGLGLPPKVYRTWKAQSFMLSADNAHACHPNQGAKADPTNRPVLNKGIVLKHHGSQKYSTDAYSAAYVKKLCRDNDIPFQTYANRSDIAGGSTLGNLAMAQVSMAAADIGLPQLAMHSAYETAGVQDMEYLVRLAKAFYNI